MPAVTLEKDHLCLRATLEDVTPTVSYDAGKARYHVRLETGSNDEIVATLTPTALQALALQCLALMPPIEPKYTVASIEDAYRQTAKSVKLHSDRSIQLLLREVQSDTLIDFLWYMKDRALIMKVVDNMSKRAAELLVQDLDEAWHGKNPDCAMESDARRGREAVLTIMKILQRLTDESNIPDILGTKEKNEGASILTKDEVDGLLTGEPKAGGEA